MSNFPRVEELLGLMRSFYGDTAENWRSFLSDGELSKIEDLLGIFYEQNRDIDEMCARQCGCSANCSLAGKEMCYIESDELEEFYRRHDIVSGEYADVWNAFAALLTFSLNARALSFAIGHTPSVEEMRDNPSCVKIFRAWQAREERRFGRVRNGGS